MSAVEGADSWCMSDFCPDQSRGAHNHIEGQTVYRAVEGADTTALRARLDVLEDWKYYGQPRMAAALRAVLDLCEVPAMRFESSEFVYVSEVRAAIADALGVQREGTP